MSDGYGKDLSRVQQKILRILSDGKPHSREELHDCLWNRDSPMQHLNPHISCIRKSLLRDGQTIVCELVKRRIYYRHVKLLVFSNESNT